MPRPFKPKTVAFSPDITYFKPRGIPLCDLEEVSIGLDELEAMRLANLEGLNQADAARKMDVHQSTFHRTLLRARKKVTDALVNGKAIQLQGGAIKMQRGRGRMRGPFAAGPGGRCRCPKCGHEMPHQRGRPCNATECPECGEVMIRA